MGIPILFDVDNVLADFNQGYLDAVARVTGELRAKDEITQWDIEKSLRLHPTVAAEVHRLIEGDGWAQRLKPLDGAVEAVESVLQMRSVDLYLVTSPWDTSKTWCYDRKRWIDSIWPGLGARTIFAKDKSVMRGRILLDDGPHNLDGFYSRNVSATCILWDMPHNRDARLAHHRVSDWETVLNIVQAVCS